MLIEFRNSIAGRAILMDAEADLDSAESLISLQTGQDDDAVVHYRHYAGHADDIT